jgi:hypothetical protein
MASKLDKLLDFYRKQLLDVNVFDEGDSGMMCYLKKTKKDKVGKIEPVTLNKTRLVLPMLQFCREGDWSDRTAFHPLAEQISEGPSPVLNAFKSYVRLRFKVTIIELCNSLAKLAVEVDRQKGMSAEAGKYMLALAEIDEKAVDMLKTVLDSSTDAPEKQIINLFLKNKTTDGSLRACQVSFPIMDDADSGDNSKFFGVDKLRKTKDKALIVAVLDYVLGDAAQRETYSSGSKNTNSPYYHSLLLSFRKFAEHLNKLIDLHSAKCENLAAFRFNLDWTEELDNFQEFAKQNGVAVPALPGNTGLEEDKIGEFEASGDDLGGADLPWYKDEDEKRRDRESRSSRDDDRRPSDREESSGKRSLSEILNKRREGRDDRDDDRDRNSDRDRDRNSSRRDERQPNWKRHSSSSRDDRDRDDDRGGRSRSGRRSMF